MMTARQMPVVLIVHTLPSINGARLALAFKQAGCTAALCCPDRAARGLNSIKRLHHYSSLLPLRSFCNAISRVEPDLIVPCDDWAVRLLHRLCAARSGLRDRHREVIRSSLGRPSGYPMVTVRHELFEVAARSGLRFPETRRVANLQELKAWLAEHGLPAVVKADFSGGGSGVIIARNTAEAIAAFKRLSGWFTFSRAIKRLLWNRDAERLLDRRWGVKAAITVQRYVPGVPANCALACWDGEVLAGVSAESVRTARECTASTVLRIIDNSDMVGTGTRIVAGLGISGFCGFDFIIEEGTGQPYLIEMNPRATQLHHLALGQHRDLVAALLARVAGAPVTERPSVTDRELIALFPHEVNRDPDSPFLETAYHDLPLGEPGFVESYAALHPGVARFLARTGNALPAG